MQIRLIEKIKLKLRDRAAGIADVLGGLIQFSVPGSGAAICFAVGKWVAGLILLAIAAAVLFRLLWRRKHADRVKLEDKLPVWAKCLALLGALAASAALVEAVKLPVRFDQPGFTMVNWLIVIVAVMLFNSWLRSLLKAVLPKTNAVVVHKPSA